VRALFGAHFKVHVAPEKEETMEMEKCPGSGVTTNSRKHTCEGCGKTLSTVFRFSGRNEMQKWDRPSGGSRRVPHHKRSKVNV
jgi:hypothetical protein